jgi:hypothetical protein
MRPLLPMVLMLAFVAGISPSQARARSLPPSAFPELPNDVVAELERLGCRIPQIAWYKRGNVIQGEFLKPGQMDWAILCTTKRDTTLLVFANGATQQPMEIARRNGKGSADRWSIGPVNQEVMLDQLRVPNRSKPLPTLDHQGISSWIGPLDPTSGRYSDSAAEGTTYYFDGSNWTKLLTVYVN